MPVATGAPRDGNVGAGWLASHAARGRAGFKPAPTAPRYAVWGRTRGVTLAPTLSRRGRGGRPSPSPQPSPVEGEEGESPSPQSSPVEGEGESPSPQPSPVEGEGESPSPLRQAQGRLHPLPSRERRESPSSAPGFALSRRGRGGESPLLRSLFSCVAGSRSPGGRAAGVCGVDGRAIGVRLVPVLFESFLDSALGGGELHGCGFFVLFLLDALGPQGLSVLGGPGGSFAASLFSGRRRLGVRRTPSWGPSTVLRTGPSTGSGQALRRCSGWALRRCSGQAQGERTRLLFCGRAGSFDWASSGRMGPPLPGPLAFAAPSQAQGLRLFDGSTGSG